MRKKIRNRIIITFIILVLFIIMYIFFKPIGLSIAVTDLETQLRSEYTTYWDDETDGDLFCCPASCTLKDDNYYHRIADKLKEEVATGVISEGCVNMYDLGVIRGSEYKGITSDINERAYRQKIYFTPKFTCTFGGDTGSIDAGGGHFTIAGAGVGNVVCESTQKWKGQEVTMILGGSSHVDCQWGGGSYVCEPYVHLTFKPHTLDSTTYDVYKNGQLTGTQSHPNGIHWTSIASSDRSSSKAGTTYYIGYKAQFECDLGANERWIETQWINSVNINDIINKDGLLPTKFCKTTRPFVLRDIQQGETAISPDPIPAFNRGQTLTSPSSNQLIIVRYAVYQVPGLENPTDGTQAYRCIQRDVNYKCLQWQLETVIKPVEVVVQCKQDSDCPLPLTQFQDTTCLGYFKGCQQNKCVYDNTILNAPKCQNQVVTIVKQIEEIEKTKIIPIGGTNIFTFTQTKDRSGSFNIGDITFSSSIPQFICSSTNDVISPPNPESKCWETNINFNNKNIKIKESEEITLLDYLKVRYFASGTYVLNKEFKNINDKTNFRNDDWNNLFVFEVDIDNAFTVDGKYGENILKDSQYFIEFNVTNNLPKGNILIKVNQKVKTTNQNLPEVILNEVYNNGLNKFKYKLNTQNLGLNNINIDIFYKIVADKENLIKVASIPLTYNIVTELPSEERILFIEKEKFIEVEKLIEINKVPIYMWYILGFSVFMILFFIIILSRRRRK